MSIPVKVKFSDGVVSFPDGGTVVVDQPATICFELTADSDRGSKLAAFGLDKNDGDFTWLPNEGGQTLPVKDTDRDGGIFNYSIAVDDATGHKFWSDPEIINKPPKAK